MPTQLTTIQRLLQKSLIRVRPALVADLIKRLLRIRRVPFETQYGIFAIDPISLLGISLSNCGVFEPAMCRTLERHLQPGSTFIDLGANEGYFSIIAGRICGPTGRVLAIEPQLRLLQVIEQNLNLNGLTNVSILNRAIGNCECDSEIYLTPSTLTGGSGFHNHSRYRLRKQKVTVTTLAKVLEDQAIHHVDLMKIDIEGHEFEALLGSPTVLESNRVKCIALELHDSILAARGKNKQEIVDLLKQTGYRLDDSTGTQVWTCA